MTTTLIIIFACVAAGVALSIAVVVLNNPHHSSIQAAVALFAFFVPLSLALYVAFGNPEMAMRDLHRFLGY